MHTNLQKIAHIERYKQTQTSLTLQFIMFCNKYNIIYGIDDYLFI